MVALIKYGPLVVGQIYKVLGEGFDWVLLSVRGRALYVPRYAVGIPQEVEVIEEDDYGNNMLIY